LLAARIGKAIFPFFFKSCIVKETLTRANPSFKKS